MTAPQIPAPGRDLANVPPFLKPETQEMQPLTRRLLGSLMIAIGAVVLINVVFRTTMIFDLQYSDRRLVSNLLAVLSSICFVVCGVTIFYRGVIWSTILLICGLILVGFAKAIV
ncbi:hypothetical protein SH661x_003048 [Planctomicrobium sp. SH661]|uniref:hypothetical protein n=1 Tax=Planctomicrobium sp. SH661 TaxID=3448124 RepID=UPI003F5AF07D